LLKYALRRLLVLIPVLFLVTILISSLIYFSPGDPVRVMLGLRAQEEAVVTIRAELGLDKPYYIRYLNWLGNAVRGNLGRSLQRNEKVMDLIRERLPATLEMTFFAVLIALIVAIPIGIISAARADTFIDNILSFFSLFWVSMPGFWIAIVAVLLLSMHWGIFPISGRGGPLWTAKGLHYLALPGLILGIRQVAIISRLIRVSMLEILNEDYIRTARSKGLAEWKVVCKHALRNAMIPTVTIFGVQLPELMSLGVIIETVFAWPGLGLYAFRSAASLDFPAIMGVGIVVATIYILANLLVDVAYAVIDPRIRVGV
jgi:peptide/nickel transport system permease protein